MVALCATLVVCSLALGFVLGSRAERRWRAGVDARIAARRHGGL